MKTENLHRGVEIPSELYLQSYKSYKELLSLRIKGGSAKLYNDTMHFNGLLSIVASKVVMNSYRDKGYLTYQEYKNMFDKYLPEVLSSNSLYNRLNRLKLSDYKRAMTLSTENYKKLSTLIIDHLSFTVIHVINTNSELHDYADKTFSSFTYHRIVKISDNFVQIWNSTQTIVKLAFLWYNSNKDREQIGWFITNIYTQIILNSSEVIQNIFLYSEYKDDINHVSVVFPMKEICPKVDVSRLIESVVISPQLQEEYEAFTKQLSNYNQSNQL